MIQTCAICTKEKATKSFPLLPGLKAVFKEVEEEVELVYLLNQHIQWKEHHIGMPTDPFSFFSPSQYNSQQYLGPAWQNQPPFYTWPPQAFSMPPWPN